jgi:hypothetical protein
MTSEEEIRRRPAGTWRLVDCHREEVATGRRRTQQFGANPTGVITYTASGHMTALITRGDRPASARSEAERAALHGAMLAYAGRWEVAGDTVRHRLEVSWQPATVGDSFVRHVAFEGERALILRSPPGPSAVDGAVAVVTVVWERAD